MVETTLKLAKLLGDVAVCDGITEGMPRIRVMLVYLGFYRNSGGERRILQLLRGLDRSHYDITL